MKQVILLFLKAGEYKLEEGIRHYLPSCGSYSSFTNYTVEEDTLDLKDVLINMREKGLAINSEGTCKIYTNPGFRKRL